MSASPLQRMMVVFQISISLVLLFSALLFVRSFHNLLTFDPGMREKGITMAFVGFQNTHLSQDHIEEYKRELVDEIRSIPGVQNAASTTNAPLMGGTWGHGVTVRGAEGHNKVHLGESRLFQHNGYPVTQRAGLQPQTIRVSLCASQWSIKRLFANI